MRINTPEPCTQRARYAFAGDQLGCMRYSFGFVLLAMIHNHSRIWVSSSTTKKHRQQKKAKIPVCFELQVVSTDLRSASFSANLI
jgi:hypothetical protein